MHVVAVTVSMWPKIYVYLVNQECSIVYGKVKNCYAKNQTQYSVQYVTYVTFVSRSVYQERLMHYYNKKLTKLHTHRNRTQDRKLLNCYCILQ